MNLVYSSLLRLFLILHFLILFVNSRKIYGEINHSSESHENSEEVVYDRRRVPGLRQLARSNKPVRHNLPSERHFHEAEDLDETEEVVPINHGRRPSRHRHNNRNHRRRFPESYEEFPENLDYDSTINSRRISTGLNHEADIPNKDLNTEEIATHSPNTALIRSRANENTATTKSTTISTTTPTTTTITTTVTTALPVHDGSDRRKLIDEFFYFLERYSSLKVAPVTAAISPVTSTSHPTTTPKPITTTPKQISTTKYTPSTKKLTRQYFTTTTTPPTTVNPAKQKEIDAFFNDYYDNPSNPDRLPSTRRQAETTEAPIFPSFGGGSNFPSFGGGSLPLDSGLIPSDTDDVAQVFKALQESTYAISYNGETKNQNRDIIASSPNFNRPQHEPPQETRSNKKKPKRIMTSALHKLETTNDHRPKQKPVANTPPSIDSFNSYVQGVTPAKRKQKPSRRINTSILEVTSTVAPKIPVRKNNARQPLSRTTDPISRQEATPRKIHSADLLPVIKLPACVIKPIRNCKKRCTPTTSKGEICLPPIDQTEECLYSTECCCPV